MFLFLVNIISNKELPAARGPSTQTQPQFQVEVSSAPVTTTTIVSSAVTTQNQVQNSFQNPQTQPTFVIPWHSIVPVLTTPSNSFSPPPSELSTPLSAPPLTSTSSQVPAPVLDLIDDEDNPEPIPVTTEDDDDVFEPESSEPGCITDNTLGNKRRSQSLSALQNTAKDTSLTKVCINNKHYLCSTYSI